jgi:hypothetical protein
MMGRFAYKYCVSAMHSRVVCSCPSLASVGLLFSAVITMGCGGGAASKAIATDPVSVTRTSASPAVPVGTPSRAVTLSNLPANPTTSTTASINYTLSGTGAVYCRLDSYTPMQCPNPFQLGMTTPLASGIHKVDYYVDSGSGIAGAAPAASYSWTVDTTSTSTSTSTSTPTPTPTAPTSTPLGTLPPTNFEGNGYDGGYSGQTITGSDGLVRIQKFENFEGTGATAYLHRIKAGDAQNWSGHRSEFSWYGNSTSAMQLGVDYWFAFAVRPISGEWPGATNDSADIEIIFQVHGLSPADLPPSFAIARYGINNSLRISANTSSSTKVTDLGKDSNIPAGVWTRFIVHQRPGNSVDHAPVVQVWRNGSLVYNVSGAAAYNSGPDFGTDYPKIGFYKWNETNYGPANTRATHYSPLFFGKGANLYEQAAAALATIK